MTTQQNTQETPIGLTPEGTESLDNAAAMAEMQKAFAQIEAMKQGKPLEEETEEKSEPEETPSEDSEKNTPEEEKAPDVPDPEEPVEDKPAPDEAKKKKKESVWDTYKREKYALLEEKETLAQENQRLKEMLEESVYRGTYHYGKSAYAALEKAIEDKKKAIEDADTDALIKSDRALIKAERAVEDLEYWLEEEKRKTSETEETQKAPSTGQPSAPAISPSQAAMAQDWMKEHPDLNPALPSYRIDKAQQVTGFINHLDAYIAQNNLQHTSFTAPYFETINNFIADLEIPAAPSAPTTPPVSQPSVAGVRNSYGGPSAEKRKLEVVLSADEKRMARNAGIPEKEWLKHKIDELRRK